MYIVKWETATGTEERTFTEWMPAKVYARSLTRRDITCGIYTQDGKYLGDGH